MEKGSAVTAIQIIPSMLSYYDHDPPNGFPQTI